MSTGSIEGILAARYWLTDQAYEALDALEDELEECTGCGLRAPADDLAECVNHIPAHGRGPYHCHDCVNSGCCGACQDQAAREWQAEHGGHR